MSSFHLDTQYLLFSLYICSCWCHYYINLRIALLGYEYPSRFSPSIGILLVAADDINALSWHNKKMLKGGCKRLSQQRLCDTCFQCSLGSHLGDNGADFNGASWDMTAEVHRHSLTVYESKGGIIMVNRWQGIIMCQYMLVTTA